jgi:hypothetical protein
MFFDMTHLRYAYTYMRNKPVFLVATSCESITMAQSMNHRIPE